MALNKELLWNDGEAVIHDDLNNAQRFASSRLYDFVVRQHADLGLQTGLAPLGNVPLVWSMGPMGYPYLHATPMHVSNRQGGIAQILSGTVTGSTPQLLIYHLAEDELDTAINAAEAGDDRTDSIFVKLSESTTDVADEETRDFKDDATGAITSQTFNKRRNVKLTKSYVAGTPAAPGASVAPATPAGYARYCDILVPAGAGGLVNPNLVDHCYGMHIETQMHSSLSPVWYPFTGGGWSLTADGWWTSAGAGNELWLPLGPCGYQTARLIAIQLYAQLQAGAVVTVRRRYMDTFGGAPTDELIETITPTLPLAGLATLAPASGAWSQVFTPTKPKPLWLNSFTAGRTTFDAITAGSKPITYLRIQAGGAGDYVTYARWFGLVCR